jgi:hypothetical protein
MWSLIANGVRPRKVRARHASSAYTAEFETLMARA